MPIGSRQVPCARVMASRKSAAVNSSQWTESGRAAGACANALDANSTDMTSDDDLRTDPPLLVCDRLYQIRRLLPGASGHRRYESKDDRAWARARARSSSP